MALLAVELLFLTRKSLRAGGEGVISPLGCSGCYLVWLCFLNIRKKQDSWYLELLPELPVVPLVLKAARRSFASRLQQFGGEPAPLSEIHSWALLSSKRLSS